MFSFSNENNMLNIKRFVNNIPYKKQELYKIEISDEAVYKIINDNFSKVFPIAKVNTMYRNGFIEMNSVSNSEEFKKVIDGDMKEIKYIRILGID